MSAKGLSLIIGLGGKHPPMAEHGDEGDSDSDVEESTEGPDEAIKEFLAAIKGGDEEVSIAAFKAAVSACK